MSHILFSPQFIPNQTLNNPTRQEIWLKANIILDYGESALMLLLFGDY